jgi:predicted enzyme related to lactoylglutathione lyase
MKGLRTAIYKVSSLADAKEWYSKVFDTQPYFDEVFYVGFDIQGYELGLVPDDDEPNVKKSTNVVVYWGVDSIQEEFDRLLVLGATVFENPENVGDGVMVATVKDPWQNVLGIIYNPFFKLK